MKTFVLRTVVVLLAATGLFFGPIQVRRPVRADEPPDIRTHGVRLNVLDMDKALGFYCDKLGFEIEDRRSYPNRVVLKTSDKTKLILNRVKKFRKMNPHDTRISFTLQVNDLDQAIAAMKSKGIEFAEQERRKEGVGYAISIRDPFDRNVSLMHVNIVKVEPFKEPKIYNFGFYIPDMDAARAFYAGKLGFVTYTEKYLPLDMPLRNKDKTFGFMLHYRPGVQSVTSEYPKAMPQNVILFETPDLEKASAALKQAGVKIVASESDRKTGVNSLVFEDPFGNVSELIEVKA